MLDDGPPVTEAPVISRNILQGDNSNLTDNSITIGEAFSEKQKHVEALDALLQKLRAEPVHGEAIGKAERSLLNLKDELTEEATPNPSTVRKWLGVTKNSLASAALGAEVVEASRKLFELFDFG